ncbi:hypothetical protein JAAARDRAFT_207639 [Jaapia argillacea MUCL 33604]|uniref:F-box domain-containing protein n=1 Tax=Jaapia argillacea MUCL 33604 TaxID=933084 RepID=A0A067PRG4_9AGAM|nr:hypothetical protein JAAARDRAFT_207639 [Jaapia argillacea MUCL 33604]
MNFLHLHLDVLCPIFSFLAQEDLARIVATSRAAQVIVTPFLLSSVHLNRDNDQIRQFCEFMLDDPSQRIPLLKKLTVTIDAWFYESARRCTIGGIKLHQVRAELPFKFIHLVCRVLEHASNLQDIYMDDLEGLLNREPALADVLIRCHRLTQVHFSGMGDRSMEMIRHMSGRKLRRIHVDGIFLRETLSDSLLPFASTLEDLTLDHIHFRAGGIDDFPSWPNVHTLRVGGSVVRLEMLFHVCPNVRNLQLDNFTGGWTQDQPFQPSPHRQPAKCWPRLQYLRCHINNLRNPLLVCPVHRLELTYKGGRWGEEYMISASNGTTQFFLDFLRRADPSVLSFTLDPTLNERFYAAFARTVPSLRFLHMNFAEPRNIEHTFDTLARLPPLLGRLPITYLSLHCEGEYAYFFEFINRQLQPILLCEIARLTPSVRYVELHWPLAGHKCSWWEIKEVGSRKVPVGLSEDMGRSMREFWLSA